MGQRLEGQEEYLEQIYRIDPDGRVPFSALTKALSVTGASVTGMCRNLADKGLVNYEPRSGVTLTEEGRRQAVRSYGVTGLLNAFSQT